MIQRVNCYFKTHLPLKVTQKDVTVNISTVQSYFALNEFRKIYKRCYGHPKSLLETPAFFVPHPLSLLQPEVVSCQPGIVDLQQDIGIVSSQGEDLEGETRDGLMNFRLA